MIKIMPFVATLILSVSIVSIAGCSQDEPLEPIGVSEENNIVDITLTVGNDLSLSRALPPGGSTPQVGTSQVDKVRIVAFTRKAGSSDSFVYDGSNDKTVGCSPENGIRIARGKLTKVAGREYRAIAIGYYAGGGEESMFGLNATAGTKFENFQATLLERAIADYDEINKGTGKYWNGKWLYTPELFYGLCYTEDENPVISFGNSSQLTGILYRGMAKVTIKITDIRQTTWTFDWFALMAETSYTQTSLKEYDSFKTPYGPVVANPDIAYKDNKWTLLDKQTVVNQEVTLSAYVLPTTTRLLIRMKSKLTTISPWQRDDYQIYVTNTSSAEGATGVISPTAQDNIFYFRRNTLYNISGTYANLSNSAHKLN